MALAVQLHPGLLTNQLPSGLVRRQPPGQSEPPLPTVAGAVSLPDSLTRTLPPLPEPGIEDKAARRQAILDAAISTFADNGFAETRTREIAAAAGVAEGTIYLYFEGKDDLLLTAFRERVAEFCESARRIMEEDSSFQSKLERFILTQFESIEESPDLATVLLVESRQTARFFGPRVRDVLRNYAAAIEGLIQFGIDTGAVRADLNVSLARRMLIGSLEEIELDWLVSNRTHSLTSLASSISALYLTGIGSQ